MKIKRKTVKGVIFFHLIVTLSSCRGQNNTYTKNDDLSGQTTEIVSGDTVKELGKHLMTMYQDKNNIFWFGSNGEGVYRYDGMNIIHFTTKHGLCNNAVRTIQEDKENNIYFTTDGGISKFNGKIFTTLKTVNNGNPYNNWKLQPDDIWFNAPQDSGVLYRYDGKDLHRLKFPRTNAGEEFITKFPRTQFPFMTYNPYDVYTIYKDKKGNIWFGTSSLGACRYDGKFWSWFSYQELGFPDPANGMRSILEDKNGNFWFSNTLNCFTVTSNNINGEKQADLIKLQKEKGIKPSTNYNKDEISFYLTATEDNSGNLWFVTYMAGVWRYDGKNLTNYIVTENEKPITLFNIYEDNKGILWVGTHENGVYKFNGETFIKFDP